MTYEREYDHAHAVSDAATHAGDLAPGHSSRSAQLVAPANPLVSGLLQRKAQSDEPVADDADTAVAAASSSRGDPLPGGLLDKFESSLGTDLSDVRVHTDPASQEAAASVGARAYTLGQDIHFAAGEYDPSSSAGEHLIAHEVAHTVQQRGGAPGRQNKLEVSSPGDTSELEADSAADAMLAAQPFSITSGAIEIARKGAGKAKKPKKASAESGEEEKKPQYPSYAGDKHTLTMPFGAGEVVLNMSENPSARVSLKHNAGKKDFLDFEKTVVPQPQIVPGIGLDIAVSAKAGVKMGGKGEAEIAWEDAPGPWREPTKQLRVSISDSFNVGLSVEGGIKIGIAFGPPGCTLAAGTGLSLAMGSDIDAKLVGNAIRNPYGDWSGQVQFIVTGNAAIEAKGHIYVDAVVATDRFNLYTHDVGSYEVGKAKVVGTVSIDLASGKPQLLPLQTEFQWNGLPAPKTKRKRKLTEAERARLFPVNQGASGAPGYVPDEVEEDDDGGGGGSGGASSGYTPPRNSSSGSSGGSSGGDSGAGGNSGNDGGGYGGGPGW